MGVMSMCGKRRQYEPDDHTHKYTERQPYGQRQMSHRHKLGDNRWQAGSIETNIDVPRNWGLMIKGIKTDAHHDRPDI